MAESDQDGNRKRNLIGVKTFPVPFPLGEKQENITITPTKTSKEEIINQAIGFHLQG